MQVSALNFGLQQLHASLPRRTTLTFKPPAVTYSASECSLAYLGDSTRINVREARSFSVDASVITDANWAGVVLTMLVLCVGLLGFSRCRQCGADKPGSAVGRQVHVVPSEPPLPATMLMSTIRPVAQPSSAQGDLGHVGVSTQGIARPMAQ